MKADESYRHLAQLFEYPRDKSTLRAAAESVARCLAENGLDGDVAPFLGYVAETGLGELQEEYVRTFDFNPLCAPYLSHHVHGDTPKKMEFMIRLKEFYRTNGFATQSCELPDHLAILFDCAAQLTAGGNGDARVKLVATYVAEGLDKMNSAVAMKEDLYWRYPIAAAALLCAADCQEVHHA